MQPMIASDAPAQRAAPCRLDHPQLQLAGCDVRLCREPTARHRRLCQHGAARRAGGRPERGYALRLSPRDTMAYVWMSIAVIAKNSLGLWDQAILWSRRAIEANRNYHQSYFWLAAAMPQSPNN